MGTGVWKVNPRFPAGWGCTLMNLGTFWTGQRLGAAANESCKSQQVEWPGGPQSVGWEGAFSAVVEQRNQTGWPWDGGAELSLQQKDNWTELEAFGKGFSST